jgi:hypothetical protein
MKFNRLYLLLAFSLLCYAGYSQTLPLTLNSGAKNQLAITESPAGTYQLSTQGGDPWVITDQLNTTYDPEQVYVISFEYLAPQGLDDLEIFYGAPFSPARNVSFGSLVSSNTFREFKAFMKLEAPSWNSAYDLFRFDFGRSAAQSITVRNLELRAATPTEVIPLTLDTSDKNQMDVTVLPDGSYDILTQGGDPWITNQTLTTVYDPEKVVTLSFDYVAPTGLDNLQVFYGTPFTPARVAQLGALPASSTPTRFEVILKVAAPSWDAYYDKFRFDFGVSSGQSINVSNLLLREATNEELKLLTPKDTINIELNVNGTSPFLTATELPDGSYQLNTTGNDPWIFSKGITDPYNIDSTYIMTLEYKAAEDYNELELFYGPPISASQRLSAGVIDTASEWTKITINPRLLVDNFQDAPRTLFRFDFGKNEGETKTIFVRNIQLRKPSAQELLDEQNSDKFTSRAINEDFLAYLNASFPDSIHQVRVDSTHIHIEGTVSNISGSYYLAEVEAHEYGFSQYSYSNLTPLTLVNGSFQLSLDRFKAKSDHSYDRLYSRWAVVSATGGGNYELASALTWPTDISYIAINNLSEDKARSVKGLDGLTPTTLYNFSDLTDLDISSMKINLLLNGVFSLNASNLTHQFNGKTYHINEGFVSNLDQRIKICSDNDIKVAFVLLIPINIGNDSLKAIFVHPDANQGLYSMGNVATELGVEHYTAMVDFLTKRYSRPDGLYGRVDQWIIHNEVDAHTSWTHAGQKPSPLYTEIYNRSMRMVYLTARKYDPTAKVFASFTKHWNSKPVSDQNFKSKEILDVLLQLSKKDGDYEWGIAWHSYPTNLFNPLVWNDPPSKTQFNFNTPEITPRNLEMIDAFVRQKEVLYNGKKVRTILLSENGFSSNTATNANANETTQAAALAYFWKKTNGRLDAIENIQLHRWVDNENEGGLLFGLWSVVPGTFDTFDEKKEGWFVWNAAGTAQEDSVFEPYKSVIGINDWSEIYNTVPTEVDPHKVDMQINNCTGQMSALLVQFNGEHKIPQEDGSVLFFNVASNTPQPYTISKNGFVLATDTLLVGQDMSIVIDLPAIDELEAIGSAADTITLSWSSSLDNLQGFILETATNSGSFTRLDTIGATTFEYQHTGLTPGALYRYRLAALFTDGTESCFSDEVTTIAPLIIPEYKDGDNGQLSNNSIRPRLLLRNTGDTPLAVSDISVRYWFTAENYDALNFFCDYAALGTADVQGSFVALESAREGANYYLDITFDSNFLIPAQGTSGEIQTRFSKTDWTDFDESDDFSYLAASTYQLADHITVYQNGQLIWGTEPAVSEVQAAELKIISANKGVTSDNSIKPELSLINEGNQGVQLEDVSIRYWFTPEGTATLNGVIDYAAMNSNDISLNFVATGISNAGAEQYLELSFAPSAGPLYAYSETGEIKLRIFKSDWSDFDELDDHSYNGSNGPLTENPNIGVYLAGQLVWGNEPVGIAPLQHAVTGPAMAIVYPNPASTECHLIWEAPIEKAEQLMLLDAAGRTIQLQPIVQDEQVSLQLPALPGGIYLLSGFINGQAFQSTLVISQ